MSNKNQSKMYILSILAILSFSTFIPALAYAAPLAASDKDWQYMNGNSWAWNYSPQTQINKDTVGRLEVKWLFPVGSKALAPASLQAIRNLGEGVSTPPIVRNGAVFITTNFLRTYAIDAKTGKQLWAHDYSINITDIQRRIPVTISAPHFHGIRYWESGDAVMVGGLACDFYGIDAKTGREKLWIKDLCANIPGSLYRYTPAVGDLNVIGTYEKGRLFIFSLRGNSGAWADRGRNVVFGINMDTKNVEWRVFNQPPQNVPVKDWALEECSIGYFQSFPCTEVAARNRAGLEWDWAPVPGEPVHWSAGVAANWGQPVVDEDTGLLYIGTGNQSPYTNLSLTPGPRLYGSTIMAIDMKAGKRAWWLQPFPHDPYDYDCNWNGILAEHPTLGKIYMKGCKEGMLYTINAITGKPLRQQDLLVETYPGQKRHHLTDPFSYYDLREWSWPQNGKYHTPDAEGYILISPTTFHGYFGSDMSYDPETQTLYHYGVNQTDRIKSLPMLGKGTPASMLTRTLPWTTTVIARDIATGKVKWTWFYPLSAQRAHMVVSGGMLFSGFTDGELKFFDKNTGKILREVNLGTTVDTGISIGKDSDGNSKIFVVAGRGRSLGLGYGPVSPAVPTTIVGLGLGRAPETTTTTATSTVTTTTTSATTSTVTTTSATTTTVTTTSATTATTTVVSTQPARTTTITSQVTESVGLPSEVTYAAVAVAVIAIIAAAVLTMRKRA